MTGPVRRLPLPATSFPFRIELFSTRDGARVWHTIVTGPGDVAIPDIATQIGCPVRARITWPDGSGHEKNPPWENPP